MTALVTLGTGEIQSTFERVYETKIGTRIVHGLATSKSVVIFIMDKCVLFFFLVGFRLIWPLKLNFLKQCAKQSTFDVFKSKTARVRVR